MKEELIYSKSINGVSLLKTLAINNVNTFCIRILNFNDLLDELNSRLGFPIKDNVITSGDAEKLAFEAFLESVTLKNPSYQDAIHFLTTLNEVRMHIINDNEEAEIKRVTEHDSNNQLLKFFKSYKEKLGNNIDSIQYARKLVNIYNLKGVDIKVECLKHFKEENLLPLEIKLLNTISHKQEEITVFSLFNSKRVDTKIASINPRYGIRNEVAHVIKDIYTNNYKLADCQIVLVNKEGYVNELFKIKKTDKLDITFETGLPINLFNGYKLYCNLNNLEKSFFDVNGYIDLFSSESIDLEKLGVTNPIQVAQLLGRMKICLDKTINDKYLEDFNYLIRNKPDEFDLFVEKIDREISRNKETIIGQVLKVIEELSKGISYFIKEYTRCSSEDIELEKAAINFIYETIDESQGLPEQYRKSYLQKIDCKFLGAESFNDSGIHVTFVSDALSVIRDHIYIVGMNSAFYPGGLTEDFLFSDDLYENLCKIPDKTENSLNFKNQYLHQSIDTFLALGKDVHLSYNSQEFNEVRELNPCSVLLDYAEDFFPKIINENDPDVFKELKEKCSYYDDELSSLNNVSKVAIANKLLKEKKVSASQKLNSKITADDYFETNAFSPSTIPSFLKCPLKFYLDNIEHADKEIQYDPLRPMGGNRFGDLLHYVMEHFVKTSPNATKNEVKAYGSELFDLYCKLDRSISDDNLEKNNFLYSIDNAYEFLVSHFNLNDSKCELKVGYGDKEFKKSSIGGVHFRGSIDLVTHDKAGNVVILDYKTGSSYDHDDEDLLKCIQGIIYSVLYEQITGTPVSKLVFYYTRFNKTFTYTSPCGKSTKEETIKLISSFKQAFIDHNFPIADEEKQDDACKYCKYENICKKAK